MKQIKYVQAKTILSNIFPNIPYFAPEMEKIRNLNALNLFSTSTIKRNLIKLNNKKINKINNKQINNKIK